MKSHGLLLILGGVFLIAVAARCNDSGPGDSGGLPDGAMADGGGRATADAGPGDGAGGQDGRADGGDDAVANDAPGDAIGAPDGQPAIKCDPVPKMKLTLVLSTATARASTPLALVQAKGDDRIFVAFRNGIIRILRGGKLDTQPFLDMSTSVAGILANSGERGLIGLALHPGFVANGRFFVYYTASRDDPYSDAMEGDIVVAEGKRSAGNPDQAEPTLKPFMVVEHSGDNVRQYDDGHNGGLLVFGRDGELWTATGDGGNGYDSFRTGQDTNHPLAKLYKLDVDNPPPDPHAVLDYVWSIGHRNPWRGSVDPATGDLYIGDVQEGHWEEINLVPYGTPKGTTNYGWGSTDKTPTPRKSCEGQADCKCVWAKAGMEGTHCFPSYFTLDDAECVPFGILPIYEYPHKDSGVVQPQPPSSCSFGVTSTSSAAVVGGFVYRGSAIPGLRGRYIFGDHTNNFIRSFVNVGGKAECVADLTADLVTAQTLVRNLVGFGEDNQGELYLFDMVGQIYKIEPEP